MWHAGVAWLEGGSVLWLSLLLDAAIKGAVLIGLAAGLGLVLRRASASARHLVWLLAICGLLCLPMLSAVLPAWRLPILPQGTTPLVAAPAEPAPAPVAAPSARPADPRPLSAVRIDDGVEPMPPSAPPTEIVTPTVLPAAPSVATHRPARRWPAVVLLI